MRAASEQTNAHIRDLEQSYVPMERLIQDLTAARAEVREYQVQHAALKERVCIVELPLVELQGGSSSLATPSDTPHCKLNRFYLLSLTTKLSFAYECRINFKNYVTVLLVEAIC